MPYGLHDGLSHKIVPHFYVDIASAIDRKEAMLACHVSQRNWLDDSQKLDSYVQTMRDMSSQMGTDSGRFTFAEGWIRHNPLGYSNLKYKPLETVLADSIVYTT
jgi:LmbE family N-acetylglucosaminyl deacetylase